MNFRYSSDIFKCTSGAVIKNNVSLDIADTGFTEQWVRPRVERGRTGLNLMMLLELLLEPVLRGGGTQGAGAAVGEDGGGRGGQGHGQGGGVEPGFGGGEAPPPPVAFDQVKEMSPHESSPRSFIY